MATTTKRILPDPDQRSESPWAVADVESRTGRSSPGSLGVGGMEGALDTRFLSGCASLSSSVPADAAQRLRTSRSTP